MAVAAAPVQVQDFSYTPCYCEENVFLLLKGLAQQQQDEHQSSQLFAVFVSNANETVPFWYQRASQERDRFGPVVWDYHVIALEVRPQSGYALVWDLDLQHPQLPFPCSLQQYAQHALQAHTIQLPQQYQRMFRLVPAASLLRHFASDRSHMRRPDGSWCAAPPPYPCIRAADGTAMNLERYRDMARDVCPDAIPMDRDTCLDISPMARAACPDASPCRAHGSPAAAAASSTAAAAAAGCGEQGTASTDSVAAAAAAEDQAVAGVAAAHPCQPAAGLQHQYCSDSAAAAAVTAAACCSSAGGQAAATAGGYGRVSSAPVPPATAAAGCSTHTPTAAAAVQHPTTSRAAPQPAAGTGAGRECQAGAGGRLSEGPGTRLVTWQDVAAASQQGPYGVVLHEHTLLRCLLGQGWGG